MVHTAKAQQGSDGARSDPARWDAMGMLGMYARDQGVGQESEPCATSVCEGGCCPCAWCTEESMYEKKWSDPEGRGRGKMR